MPETVDAPVTSQPEKASFFEDLIDIFGAPAKVFARRLDRGVFLTIVIFTVLGLVLAYANRGPMQGAIDGEIDRQIAKIVEQNPAMTAEQMAPMRSWMTFSFTYGIAIFLPVYFLIVGLCAWLAGKIFGAASSYGDALMVATWSFVPRFVALILVALQGLLMDVTTVRGIFEFSFSPARFFDPDTTSMAVLGILSRFDLFMLWQTALIGIGLAVVGKIPRGKAMGAAAAVWLIGAVPILFQFLQG